MDSKTWKLSVLASVSVLLLILILVVGLNGRENTGKKTSQTSPKQENVADTSALEVHSDGQVGNDLSAFMRDEYFFDQELNPVLEAARQETEKLSLIVISVQKDLRVQIVDEQGKPVTGKSFFVRVDDAGEYKDLDQDGIIYIGDLKAGQAKVTLLPVEGYSVPEPITVKIKERVEYVPIDDILLLIKDESEVNATLEDSMVCEAVEEAEQPQVTEPIQVTSGITKAGIDVSKWQKEIDWEKVKQAGVDFAIIRAGYRGSVTGALVEDPYFKANMQGAKEAGIELGVYFFTQATNEVEAVEEASMVIALLQDEKLDFPVYIDTEGAGGNGRADHLDVATRTLVCDAFCRTVKNAGYQSGVYASRNWYTNCLNTSQLEDYSIWLAEYRDQPLYKGKYQMWQYTSKGSVDGIAGNVDLNIFYSKEMQ